MKFVGAADTVVFQGKFERALQEFANVDSPPLACLQPVQAEQGNDDTIDFIRVVKSLHPYGLPKKFLGWIRAPR